MRRVLTALPAKLAELQPVRGRLPVLGRGVVLVFARGALQLNNFPWHHFFLVVPSLRDSDSFSLAYPALPRWTNECRRYAAGTVSHRASAF